MQHPCKQTPEYKEYHRNYNRAYMRRWVPAQRAKLIEALITNRGWRSDV